MKRAAVTRVEAEIGGGEGISGIEECAAAELNMMNELLSRSTKSGWSKV